MASPDSHTTPAQPTYQIRPLALSDVPAALQHCRVAGWNQTAGHWETLIRLQPQGCFAAVTQSELVGTVTTTCYGRQLAWIGMMLVDPTFRRRGIASRLMQQALAHLHQQKTRCIKLDATPAGQPVYERFGFRPEFSFNRWERPGDQPTCGPKPTNPLDPTHRDLDRRAFGADRWQLLNEFSREAAVVSRAGGYGMLRHGHLANYVGPLVARSAVAAEEVLRTLLRGSKARLFWDMPSDNDQSMELAERFGFQRTRELTRMVKGEKGPETDAALQYAIAGPSVG